VRSRKVPLPKTRRRRSQLTSPRAARDSLLALRQALRRFAKERDWDQFHSPRNLATALCVESAELLEHFQWLTDATSKSLPSETRQRVREEMADVLLYLVRLADRLDVDLLEAATDKLRLNAQKYPVEKARGSSRKYTDL
jgi:NTP pyrophosphatase (non-canonical NTP hydrolase)